MQRIIRPDTDGNTIAFQRLGADRILVLQDFARRLQTAGQLRWHLHVGQLLALEFWLCLSLAVTGPLEPFDPPPHS